MVEKRGLLILPNLLGALTLTLLISGAAAGLVLWIWFDVSLLYRLCMLAGFVTLCGIWIVVIFASSIKAYLQIFLAFLLGYGITLGAALGLREYGVEGMLFGFVLGQAVLFFVLLGVVVREYPGERLAAFDFLRRGRVFPSLLLTGLFYNLGIWADKFILWADPFTSVAVIGPLRSSPIYDLPIFLAYLSIIPGMAILSCKLERLELETFMLQQASG